MKRGPRFGIEKPAIPGPGRPRIPDEVKALRKEAREILKDAAPEMAARLAMLARCGDPDIEVKAIKVALDKVLPNLEEVENFEHRPLREFTDEQLEHKLAEIRSGRNGHRSGTGEAA